MTRRRVVGLGIDRVDYDAAVARILDAARAKRPMRVAAANVHVVMEAHDDPTLARHLESFELVEPDGQPLRWALDAQSERKLPDRVYGPELTRRVLTACAKDGLSVFFYGATEAVLDALVTRVEAKLAPGIEVAGALAPPFGEALWRAADDDVARIRASGARVVFVGLGCPKQELWVGVHGPRIDAPCLAVGAAFDLLAGAKPMAPRVLQDHGLEWLYRLATEPRRTFRRYALHNPRFAVRAAAEVVATRLGTGRRGR